jgi:hypothetical protein
METLDRELDQDPTFNVFYNTRQNGCCVWGRELEGKLHSKSPKMAPIYARRRLEQQRTLDGKMKRGHRAFGFMPPEGYS